jgi:hypothetical protein
MLNKILAAIVAMCISPAYALVLTLDGVPSWLDYEDGNNGNFGESGFQMAGWSYTNDGMIHVVDSTVAPWNSSVVLSGSGRFDVSSLNIVGHGSLLYYEVLEPTNFFFLDLIDQVAYPNVLVEGIRDGEVVAETRFYADESYTHTLSQDFKRLDSLFISAVGPFDPAVSGYLAEFEAGLESLYPGSTFRRDCFDFPCGQFDLDAIEVSPVPIPASLLLVLSAVFLGGIARKLSRNEGNDT